MIPFYGEELLAPYPNPKLEGHTLSAVRDCLFNILAAALHIRGRSSIRKRRTCHVVVTGTRFSHGVDQYTLKIMQRILTHSSFSIFNFILPADQIFTKLPTQHNTTQHKRWNRPAIYNHLNQLHCIKHFSPCS